MRLRLPLPSPCACACKGLGQGGPGQGRGRLRTFGRVGPPDKPLGLRRHIARVESKAEHEKLEVYRRALDFSDQSEVLAGTIPHRRADLQDQLRRASSSIPLNIAEGAGEFSPADKARFYRIARRSAAECSAILDVLGRTVGPVDPRLQQELREIAAMLTAMVKTAESRRA